MRKKSLISAVVIFALCVSLVAGATLALFTSEARINVAMTSGTVDVKASVLKDSIETSSFGIPQTPGYFECGGVAEFDAESNLNLTNMVPGDSVKFKIEIKNYSDVAVKYRVKWAVEGELLGVLEASADGMEIIDNTTAWATWYTPATEADKVKTVPVEIKLPIDVGDAYQNKSAKITFIVEAVQGNAVLAEVDSYESLLEAIGGAERGEMLDITLVGDIHLPETVSITTTTTINANGKTITTSADSFFSVAQGSDTDFTIKNATLSASDYVESAISFDNRGSLKLESVNVTGNIGCAVSLLAAADYAKLSIKGSSLEGASAISVLGENTTVTVDGSSFVNTSADAATIKFIKDATSSAKDSTLVLKNSTVGANADGVAIEDATGSVYMDISDDTTIGGEILVSGSAAQVIFSSSADLYSSTTLQGAVNFAFSNTANGSVVKLNSDLAEDIAIPENASVVIDLGGFEYTGVIVNEGTVTIKGATEGDVTVVGGGTVTYE